MQTPFNKLNPAQAERLALLLEECGEVIHIIGKIQRHGFDSRHPDGGPTNRELLEFELGHVDFAKQFLITHDDIRGFEVARSYIEKPKTVGRYLHHNVAPKS